MDADPLLLFGIGRSGAVRRRKPNHVEQRALYIANFRDQGQQLQSLGSGAEAMQDIGKISARPQSRRLADICMACKED